MSSIQDFSAFGEHLLNFSPAIDDAADEVGRQMSEMIRIRVRLGYGTSKNNVKREKLRELKPKTIERRSKFVLFPGSSPARSHLTMTGQMMNSLTYRKEPGKVVLFFNDAYADKKALWNNEGKYKRPFFYLTSPEYQQATKIFQKALDDYVDQIASNL